MYGLGVLVAFISCIRYRLVYLSQGEVVIDLTKLRIDVPNRICLQLTDSPSRQIYSRSSGPDEHDHNASYPLLKTNEVCADPSRVDIAIMMLLEVNNPAGHMFSADQKKTGCTAIS